jgi:CRISPR-associated protein Csb1
MNATAAIPVEVTADLLTMWATDPAGPVALHLKQQLLPVTANEGEPGIIYPPTYADIGYSIDTLADETRVALIDSVGSQANRMEPIFKEKFSANRANDKVEWLVPQIEIILSPEKGKNQEKVSEQPYREKRSLLDLAHRSADAVVQSCPDLKKLFDPAFESLRRGDAGPLCKLAPTSLVFGVWDSRGGSGEKRPRLVRSVIRAWGVDVLHAAAQYNSVWKALDDDQQNDLKRDAKAKKVELSVKGFADAPAVFRKTKLPIPRLKDGAPNPEARVLGGILVRDRIEREVTVNLLALRNLRGDTPDETRKIQKYLLGLALLAATHEIDLFLREGCQLRYAATDDVWFAIPRRGVPDKTNLGSKAVQTAILEFTLASAEAYLKSEGTQKSAWPIKSRDFTFSLAEAKKLLAKKEEEHPDGGEK